MTMKVATAAVKAGDFGAARDAAIAIWRTRRSTNLAAAIAILDAKAPDATTAAIAGIVTSRADSSLANLKKLAKLDDPRLAAWAIDALVKLPFTAVTAREFLVAIAKTAARHADPRLAARAPEITVALATRIGRLALRTELQAIVDAAVAATKVPKLSTADATAEATLAKSVESLGGDRRAADSLLAEIYANPADDGPRLVYADVLTKQGDPRGELIVLQIERGARKPGKRELELLRQYGKAWLGELAPVLSWGKGNSGTEFRRGFLAKADIILSVGKKLRPILKHPAWATVEEIEGLYDDESGLLANAPLRALRELEIDELDWLPKLAKRSEKLAAVTRIILSESFDDPPDGALLRKAFPNVASVTFAVDQLTAAHLEMVNGFGIEHVDLFTNQVSKGFVANLVGTPTEVARLTIRCGKRTEELVRDAKGRYARA
ncbi:MAG: TIGR02996 domain-containing protein [Kofleriaceae bacterium]